MLWSSPHGKPPPPPPRQTALRLVTGSSPAYHHLSRAFFYLPFQLQIMATPWARTPPGSRDPQQPEHLFPFSWGVVGFPPEQMGLELSHDFCECGQGKEEEKKKKARLYKDIFYFSTFKTKRKENNSRTGCTFTQGFISPAPLHCSLFPFTIRNCIEFVFQSEN